MPHSNSYHAGPSSTPGFLRRRSTSSNYSDAIDTTSLIDSQIPDVSHRTVHQYTLKSNAFIIIKSHAYDAQDPPLLYFGEDIIGYVLSDPSDIQRVDVVVSPFPSWYDCN
jgi:hypothetical protein